MTPSPSATRIKRPATIPPAHSQRFGIPSDLMPSGYNNEPVGFRSLTSQREDVPVILHVVDPHRPVPDRHALLVVEHALAVGTVDGDREIDPLVVAIAEHDRRRALGELERVRLLLHERDRPARQLVERVPRRERWLLQLLVELL